MFWCVKSKLLDRLFPWRNNHVMNWELKWWQRLFLQFCDWRANCNYAIKRLLFWRIKRYQNLEGSKDIKLFKHDLRLAIISLFLIFGWWFLCEVLFWRLLRTFGWRPKSEREQTPRKPFVTFLPDVPQEQLDAFYNKINSAEQLIYAYHLQQQHEQGEIYISSLEELAIKMGFDLKGVS